MTMNMPEIEKGMSQKWKDRFQYGAAGFLILSAVVLAFVSFIITLTVGAGVITWGGLSMGTALTLIGGGMYFHNQLVTFETKTNRRMEEMAAQVDKEIEKLDRHHERHQERYGKRVTRMAEEDYFNPEEGGDQSEQ